MREIKFRVWDGEEFKKPTSWLGNYDDLYLEDLNNLLNEKDYIFQQYTGLKDRHGKEIFEGDIVKRVYVGGDVNLEEIKYDTGSYVFHIPGHPEDEIMDNKNSIKCAVIGNIYENSELL